jgi:hypothetical protein
MVFFASLREHAFLIFVRSPLLGSVARDIFLPTLARNLLLRNWGDAEEEFFRAKAQRRKEEIESSASMYRPPAI